jgi:hypothetical protein
MSVSFPGSDWFRLDDKGEPVRIGNIDAYMAHVLKCGGENKAAGLWGHPKQVVARSLVGNFKVSTVFLFLDHNWDPKGKPLLWETMAFRFDKTKTMKETNAARVRLGLQPRKPTAWDSYTGEDIWRCGGSREQAEAQHLKACRMIARREKVPVSALVLEMPE